MAATADAHRRSFDTNMNNLDQLSIWIIELCDKISECSVTGGRALPLPAFANVNESTFHVSIYIEKYVHTVCIENFINQWM